VARVAAFIPDLLFGSNVVGALKAAGHEVSLVSEPIAEPDVDVLVVDLTVDAPRRIEQVLAAGPPRPKTLAFYSHVETDVRALAESARFDLVVPRSRMAREAPALVAKLSAGE
jgi:hypothetical protein